MKETCRHQQFVCFPHPAKVFFGAFLIGFFCARDRKGRKSHAGNEEPELQGSRGVMWPPWTPIPYDYRDVNITTNTSVGLMVYLSDQLFRTSVGVDKEKDEEEREEKLQLKYPVHYNYASMRKEYKL